MMRRALVLVSLLLFVACASEEVHVVTRNDLPRDLYPQGRQVSDPSREARVTLFMLEGNRLVAVSRTGRSDLRLPELVLRALLSGPTQTELEQGLATALPPPIELTSVSVDGGVADVDFNEAFKTAVRDEMLRRVAQVVYTLSELDDVDSVRFFTNSQRLTVPDQNGDPHSDGVARARYSRFAPRNPLDEPSLSAPLRIDVRDELGRNEAAVP